jgi:hypothetical protein
MSAEKIIQTYLEQIIDDMHPLFTPISDECSLGERDNALEFTRDFLHKNGKKFRMTWIVSGDDPRNVKTYFLPATIIE